MPRQRPPAVVVLAVLHLVFGGLDLFCTVCGGVMQLTGGQQTLEKMADAEQRQRAEVQKRRQQISEEVHRARVPLYQAYSVTNRVLSLVFCVALVASGIGLLSLQPWARWVSVGYAVLSILANVVDFVYTIAFMIPADVEVFRVLPPQNEQEQMAYNIARVAAPGGPCLMMIYPAVVLIILLLPSVGAAFRPEPRRRKRRRFEEDYDDEPDDEDEDDDRIRRRRR